MTQKEPVKNTKFKQTKKHIKDTPNMAHIVTFRLHILLLDRGLQLCMQLADYSI